MLDYLDLLGTPFEYQGRGPDTYDCYGLLSELYRRLGITIPDYKSPNNLIEIADIMGREKRLWEPLWIRDKEAPNLSDIPLHSTIMFNVQGLVCHVGFVVAPNKFIHTWEGIGGVAVERVSLWRQRIAGIYQFND